jgi:2-amino-4-hydroxy-6-hydroxymethyldihydropteridine diphosphokinase
VTLVYLGLGSNLGRREDHLAHAIARLQAFARPGTKLAVSSVYETDPVGHLEQPRFLNMVASLETDLEPEALLHRVREIEAERGRERSFRDAPRTLDIDLLLYGDRRVRSRRLTIPHPRMNDRPFVLVPLLELDPDLQEPGTGRRYVDILGQPGQAALEPALSGDRLVARGREADHEA